VSARLQLSKDHLVELVNVLGRETASRSSFTHSHNGSTGITSLTWVGKWLDFRPHPELLHQFADRVAV